jgi:hypothetical protein
MEFAGMGHDLPSVLWAPMADAIASNARRTGITTPAEPASTSALSES